MAAKNLTISLNSGLYSILEKRAKKLHFDVEELVADIIRRSMASYKGTLGIEDQVDDKLISIFSRQRRGRKRKLTP